MSDLDTLTERLKAAATFAPRFPSPGQPSLVGQVVTVGPKLAPGKFFLVNPVAVFGTEAEGSPGSISADPTGTVPVYLIGPGIPAAGDLLVCRFVDYRWVAERKGTVQGPTFNCNGCQIPGTIYVTDPVYGVTTTLTNTSNATNPSWTGQSTYSYPGFAGAAGGPAPAGNVTVAFVFNCGLNSLRVQAGQADPVTNVAWPGAVSAPNFQFQGVLSPMSGRKLSFTCNGPGSFAATYSGTTAGSYLMSNLFRVDTGQHPFNFALSSVHP